MIHKAGAFVLILSLFTAPLAATAQEAKVYRIGYLAAANPRSVPFFQAFEQRLRELGYIEGRNLTFEYRNADGSLDRLPGLAAELVRLNVNVIVTATDAATRAVTEATGTIPILIVGVNYDPVARGFAASLARPGRKSAPIYRARRDIAQLALKHRLPTSFAFREYVDAGGLLAYGVNFSSMFRRAAEYVARTAPVSTPSCWHSLARG